MPRLLSFLRGWDAIVAGLLFVFTVVRNPGGLASTVAAARRSRLRLAMVDAAPFTAPPVLAPLASSAAVQPEGGDEPALIVSALDVDRGPTPVLRGVSLAVTPRRVVAVVGPNGAGKSTLLDAVSGFVPCRAGTIMVRGTEVTAMAAHRRPALGLGRTFQRLGLPADMPLQEALLVAGDAPGAWHGVGDLVGTPAARRREREAKGTADATLERLGLAGLGALPVRELSVGQQRLVELAAALAGDQQLLLLDEPSAGLAPAAVEALSAQIEQLRDAGRSILLVEHDLPLVRAVADEVVVLACGRVVASGAAVDVLADSGVVDAWLGARPGDR